MTDSTTTPIIVNASPLADQAKQAASYAVALLGGLGLLSRFLTPAQLAYVQSSDFIATVSTLATIGVFVWRQIEVRIKKKQAVIVANAAPDNVAVVRS